MPKYWKQFERFKMFGYFLFFIFIFLVLRYSALPVTTLHSCSWPKRLPVLVNSVCLLHVVGYRTEHLWQCHCLVCKNAVCVQNYKNKLLPFSAVSKFMFSISHQMVPELCRPNAVFLIVRSLASYVALLPHFTENAVVLPLQALPFSQIYFFRSIFHHIP